jgi:hypothetical protein
MNWLIVTPEKKVELDAINAQFTDRKANPEMTDDGTMIIWDDLLNDNYWEAYQNFLKSLDVYDKDPVWPVIPEE